MQLFYVLRKTARRARRALGGDLRFRIYLLAGVLLILFVLHLLAMVLLEGLSVGDAAWLTITTATTVGYGDISAATPAGRWATVLLMYVGGIFVLAQVAGLIFEAAQSRMERQRRGKVPIKARGHVVVFGWREAYLRRVVEELRGSIGDLREEEVVVVSPHLETLPDDLIRNNVLHVQGELYDADTLHKANVRHASRIAILPEPGSEETVYANLELIARLAAAAPDVPIVYAARNNSGKTLAEDLGVADALYFNPNYPDIFSRAIITIGAEDIVDELIDRNGVELLVLQEGMNATVGELIDRCGDTATLLAVRAGHGQYLLHPPRERPLTDERLIFLVDTDRFGSGEAAEKVLRELLRPLLTDRELTPFTEPRRVGIIGTAKRADEQFLQRLQGQLDNSEVISLGAGVLSAGGQWKKDELPELDAVVLLAADPTDPATDARTFLFIRQLRQRLNYGGRIIAEAVLPGNRERFEASGVDDVLRPVVRNVEILARCITTGAEEILDNLYSSFGGQELISLDVRVGATWGEFARQIHAVGLPLAFERDGTRHILPAHDWAPGAGKVFLLVDTDRYGSLKAVRKALLTLSPQPSR